MKRVYYGLLAVFLALVLCVSPGWAKTFAELASDVANGKLSGTYSLGSNEETTYKDGVTITATKTIDGGNATIDGGGKVRIFKITNSGTSEMTVTIKNLTIKNGKLEVTPFGDGNWSTSDTGSRGGAGIYAKNTNLELENVNFSGNEVTLKSGSSVNGNPSDSGGALCFEITKDTEAIAATLTITSCDFSENVAPCYGGGVYTWTAGKKATLEVNVTKSNFEKNDTAAAGHGGAVAIQTNFVNSAPDTPEAQHVKSTIENCTFTNNGGNVNDGGAIEFYAGNGPASADVINCTFSGNSAKRLGGAINNWSYVMLEVNITNCLFDSNKKTESDNGGGAISNRARCWDTNIKPSILNTIDSCTFTSNNSTAQGGAILNMHENTGTGAITQTVTNSTFYKNNATTNGGAITNAMGSLANKTTTQNIINCTFVGNKAGESGTGAEIYNSAATGTTSTVTVTNSVFHNTATGYIANASGGGTETITFKSSVYSGTGTPGVNDATNLISATLTNNAKPENVTVSGVKHTVFKLTASDTDLIDDGTAVADVKTDQLGVTRDTSKPSIGAVEYLTLAGSSSVKALTAGTVGVVYSADLDTSTFTFTPAQSNVKFVWATAVSSGDLPDGIKISGDQVAGTPTKAGTYYFTIDATGSGDVWSSYAASQDFSLVINAAPVVTSSPDIGTVSITVKNAVGSNTAAFSVTSSDVKLVTSNDLTSSVKVNGTAYKLASSDATPVFSVNAGNATLKAAYMGDANSDWSSTADLDALTITNLTAISGREAISETSRDYYRFQFNVSNDYYFTLELSVLLSGEPEAKVTSDEVKSGSVTAQTETITSGDETYYYVPANGSDNLVTKNASGVWQLPRVISFAIVQGGFSGLISRMSAIERTIAQIITGIFAPNSDGLFTNIGAALSKPVHPGTIFIIRLAPSGWRLPFMTGFERGAMRVAKVEDGAIIGAMTVQNTAGNSNINEEISTLKIDTSDLRDPDDSTKKVPVPEGAYAISYSTLTGEVSGAFSDDIKVAAANYTPSNGDDDTDTDDGQETSTHGGSSGCNAGFGLFALAALALAYRKFSK